MKLVESAEQLERSLLAEGNRTLRRGAWILAAASFLWLVFRLWSKGVPEWRVGLYLMFVAGLVSIPFLISAGVSHARAGLVLTCSASGFIATAALGWGGLEAPFLPLLPVFSLAALYLGGQTSWITAGWVALLMAGLASFEWLAAPATGLPLRWPVAVWIACTAFLVAAATSLYERRAGRVSRALEVHATKDHLTGLANRRHFEEQLEHECRRAARDTSSLAVILLDVDHFKGFNDAYGHMHGDRCLVAVAYAAGTCVRRAGDLLARFGGEEFIAVFPNTNEAQALEVAEAMRAAVREMDIPHARSASKIVTISLGVAAGAGEALVPGQLVLRADEALYRAKEAGRDRVEAAADAPPPTKA